MLDPIKDPKTVGHLVAAISPGVQRLKEQIGERYTFSVAAKTRKKIGALVGKDWVGNSPYEQNINLRSVLQGKVIICSSDESWTLNEPVCQWIVADWGGTDRKESLSRKANAVIADRLKAWRVVQGPNVNASHPRRLGFARISSWSKILALAFPVDCAIYDSRTAYALNWLQFNVNLERPNAEQFKYWPVPAGRNTLLDMFDYSQLLPALSIADYSQQVRKEQEANGADASKAARSMLAKRFRKHFEVDASLAYVAYCATLKGLAAVVFNGEDNALLKTEMLLFASATGAIPADVADTLAKSISGLRTVPSSNN